MLEGAISGKKGCRKASSAILKASRQKHSSWQLYSNDKSGLQQLQMESFQQIKDWRIRRRCTVCVGVRAALCVSCLYFKSFHCVLIIKANKMHYFSTLFWETSIHVSDRLTVHHQESKYCIHSKWYLSY
jgi:hypothetical protein